MSPSNLSVLIFCLFVSSSLTNGATPPKPKAFTFPIKKDATTNQYYTTIQIGANFTTFNTVIDLGGKFAWFNSIDYFESASGYRPILCGTQQCRIANGIGCVFCFLSPPVPGCTNNTCSDYALNPFSGTQGYSGLGQDTLHVFSTRGDRYDLKDFPFQFSDPVLRDELASQTAGLVGLGRTRISLQAQIASAFKVRQQFALCIPSTGNEGKLIVGQGNYNSPFEVISKKLTTTSLIRNPVSTDMNERIGNLSVEYFINVKSIKVGNKALSLNNTLLSINKRTGTGGTNLRTVRHYTILHRSIYRALVNGFVAAAASKNIKRVASVSPFGACFDSKTIINTKTGPDVPNIDFVLDTTSVFWRFLGSNSMVKVNNDVTCLAFLDGGVDPFTSIVLGGYQMQDYLLEFDVASSKLRFSSSLLALGTSCSQFGAS
ncbi:putative aspartic proteinase GIP2 [Primulina tabacum]|uniref:putative aspartic proteinase GIP2 n=1 Tax=Primulina tabacum TaxID=48773 RepID=UPI003F5A64DC